MSETRLQDETAAPQDSATMAKPARTDRYSVESIPPTSAIRISARDQALMRCADPGSTRYALGGVYFDGRVACATDGRFLAARFSDSETGERPMVAQFLGAPNKNGIRKPIMDQRSLPGKDHSVYQPIDGAMVDIHGGQAIEFCEGRFPRWHDVVPSERPIARVRLDIALLLELAKALQGPDDQRTTLTLEILGPKAPVLVSNDHTGFGVIMPLTHDDGEDRSQPAQAIFARMAHPECAGWTVADETKALADGMSYCEFVYSKTHPAPADVQESEAPAESSEPEPEPAPADDVPMADDADVAQDPIEPAPADISEPAPAAPVQVKPKREPKQAPADKYAYVLWSLVETRFKEGESFPKIARSLDVPAAVVRKHLESVGLIAVQVA